MATTSRRDIFKAQMDELKNDISSLSTKMQRSENENLNNLIPNNSNEGSYL